eukprot:3419460-Prorocentrum_lima.AAC.1
MTSSLVGSEMCIRDRFRGASIRDAYTTLQAELQASSSAWASVTTLQATRCLLYTSDAADDM